MQINEPGLKITVKLKSIKTLIGMAMVTIPTMYLGNITIKDLLIWKSSRLNSRLGEFINITPPQKNFHAKYFDVVWFENIKNWYELESRIYDAYVIAQREEVSKESLNIDEKVDPTDIPF